MCEFDFISAYLLRFRLVFGAEIGADIGAIYDALFEWNILANLFFIAFNGLLFTILVLLCLTPIGTGCTFAVMISQKKNSKK